VSCAMRPGPGQWLRGVAPHSPKSSERPNHRARRAPASVSRVSVLDGRRGFTRCGCLSPSPHRAKPHKERQLAIGLGAPPIGAGKHRPCARRQGPLQNVARQIRVLRTIEPRCLVDDHLWEVGPAWIGPRSHMIPVWLGRRLGHPTILRAATSALRERANGRTGLLLITGRGLRCHVSPAG
jgi:hypothetical protein